jgi:hypothetical protein
VSEDAQAPAPNNIPSSSEAPDAPAREVSRPGANGLPYKAPCRYCAVEVIVARMDDGHWNTFDTQEYPPNVEGVFVWHNRLGMQEFARNGRPISRSERMVPGVRLHYCVERTDKKMRLDLPATPQGAPLPDRRPKF